MFGLFGGPAVSGSKKLADDIARKQQAHRNLPFSGGLPSATPVAKAASAEPVNVNAPVLLSLGADYEARKATAARDAALAGREVVAKRADRSRAVVIRSVLPTMSARAAQAFDLLLSRYNEAGRNFVRLPASDIAKATGMRESEATAALVELESFRLLETAVDSFGVRRIKPSATALG